MFLYKAKIGFLILLSYCLSILPVFGIDLVVGGENVGIILNYDGLVVSGFYNTNSFNPKDYFKVNDCISHVDGKKIDSISDIYQVLQDTSINQHLFTISRNHQTINIKVPIDKTKAGFDCGLYVMESTKGLGTVTYYNPKNGKFACLGHKMTNGDYQIIGGNIYESIINGIHPSSKGDVGYKIGHISSKQIGTIEKENDYGLFGTINQIPNKQIYQSAKREEITLGEAYFLTVLNGTTQCKVDITITQLQNQDSPGQKGISFTITNKDVLNQANGIVQGMSGSPIIQNNKIIGCVTHANSITPNKGYGMYIEWMIENS